MRQKQKSLRQLASELGVSHSYLSQIAHGKRPASPELVSKMSKMVSNNGLLEFATAKARCYNSIRKIAELCSGSTEDFGSFSPGS
ncbi:MAG: helix-turn-helix transcriptional regulator, partial [Candidatus Tectomicrobia bacterium]|nr:helix-turn-helix transcriptional regulator [Candidatus Tectomicrobia bacterium]